MNRELSGETHAIVADAVPESSVHVHNDDRDLWLLRGDAVATMDSLHAAGLAGAVDLVFADPPYFVGKAAWDRPRSLAESLQFHEAWISSCRRLLKPNGSLWACGNYRSIHAVGITLERLGMKLLCAVTWERPNPRPRAGCFASSTDTLLWAARSANSSWCFNAEQMRAINNGHPMQSHWRLSSASRKQRRIYGRHPAEKPLPLVERCLLASTRPGDLVLDPFVGSGTTAVAARRLGRRCIGIDREPSYLRIAERRLQMERDHNGSPVERGDQ